ncbi:MAG: carboxymuconolactone decarboxylase family protein [Vicinamibacterales bacterium]
MIRSATRVLLGCGLVLVSGLPSAAQTTAQAQSVPAPRFPQLTLEQISAEQRVVAERLLEQTRTGMGGPWNMALRSAPVAQGVFDLYNYFRWSSTLPPRLVELGIVTTAREFDAGFIWQVHQPLAAEAGVSREALAALRDGRRPEGFKPDEQAVYDLATEFLRRRVVSNDTFVRARAALGERGVVDLAALVGTYVTFSAFVNIPELPNSRPADAPDFLPPLSR